MWVPFILLLITFEAIADIFSKKYALTGTVRNWIFAISGYVIANAFWLMAIRCGSGLARGAILFSVGSAVAAVVIGLVWYKESLSYLQIAGIVAGIIAIGLFSAAEFV
jgi:multidrug transporter EmrE-like cation transporter